MNKIHIAIAGNIGAGKTTLTKKLAKHYNWKAHLESIDKNPYLEDFYREMERWSFNLQVYFLNHRFKQYLKIKESKENTIQDRTIYEDVYIFASNLHAMGLLTKRDYDNYASLFELMESLISPPDLVIYLRASTKTLNRQIQKRGRKSEMNISPNYLERLNERYEAWATTYKGNLLTIDANNLDYVKSTDDLHKVIEKIDLQLETCK